MKVISLNKLTPNNLLDPTLTPKIAKKGKKKSSNLPPKAKKIKKTEIKSLQNESYHSV